MPYWAAFDLDQTIGCFEAVHPYLIVFFPDMLQELYKAPYYKGPPMPVLDLSPRDKATLALAFGDFIKWMAVAEKKNKLIRPGIVPILNLLLDAKKARLVGGLMIYSNNSNPYMLKFAHELLKALMGLSTAIFCPIVGWWHTVRDSEVRNPKSPFIMSHGPKRALTIQKAFSKEYCGVGQYYANPGTADILFFDDLVHADIHNIIPAQNYFHVQPYHSFGDIATIHNCFLNALMIHDLDKNAGALKEFEKVGLKIGPAGLDINTFKVPVRAEHDVNDGGFLLARLEKLLGFKAGAVKDVVINARAPAFRPFAPALKVSGLVTRRGGFGFNKKRTTRRR